MFLKSSLKCIFFLGLFAANSLVAKAETDCDTLATIYDYFEIKNEASWKANSNECCKSEGITCVNDKITVIDLQGKDIKGTIPVEIGSLTELTTLDLRLNHMTGEIPKSIGNNKKLKIFNIGGNEKFSGKLPKELCSLTNLEELYVYNNILSGSIPKCLGELSNLRELCLDNNQFTGSIPEEIGNLKNLEHLDLENNNLTGSIPESFNNLEKLNNFNIQGNKDLIGQVPDIKGLSKCNFENTNLCVKGDTNSCTEGLRKCTDDDVKKVKEYKESNPTGTTDDDEDKDNAGDKKSGGGSNAGIIILIIALVLLLLVAGLFLYRKFSKKDDKDKEFHIPESMENIINEDYNHQSPKEKSFVVLSPKQEPPDDEPPQLTLDESAFNYYDVSPRMREKHASNVSTGINQEQYEKQLQYQNLINNQNYYLS